MSDVDALRREIASLRDELAHALTSISVARHDGWIAGRDRLADKMHAWAMDFDPDEFRRLLLSCEKDLRALQPDAEPARPPEVVPETPDERRAREVARIRAQQQPPELAPVTEGRRVPKVGDAVEVRWWHPKRGGGATTWSAVKVLWVLAADGACSFGFRGPRDGVTMWERQIADEGIDWRWPDPAKGEG